MRAEGSLSTGSDRESGPVSATESIRLLEAKFAACRLLRSFRRAAYDAGDELDYEVMGVFPATRARVRLEVERFVGGGFAGQVYRVRVLEIEAATGPGLEGEDTPPSRAETVRGGSVAGLQAGRHYAIKILTPPSGFARIFRNLLYFVGYQASFGAQVLPSAVRSGVLWQKLIRRAMAIETGDGEAVCDTYATFYDAELRSHGEINEWIDGRIWKFEADETLFDRWDFARGDREGGEDPGGALLLERMPRDHRSPEYVHKKLFMRRLVALLHRMGAGELARQYEWWTLKSTPNVLKRLTAEGSPDRGLTAVDFRAGLTLLPFLPMSPADIVLVLKGLVRGRLVQFDRCDMRKLRRFVDANEGFDDLRPAVEELERQTEIYRSSQPDVTHHHVRLLSSRRLRRSVRAGAITAWRSLGRLDVDRAGELGDRGGLFAAFWLASLVPGIGPLAVTLWGNAASRGHFRRCWSSASYLGRAMRGSRIEILVRWLRQGRVSARRSGILADRAARFWLERLTVGWLPPAWHRFFADWTWARKKVGERVAFIMGFLRDPGFRERFLLDEVRSGGREGMLTDAETARIEAQIKDPFIQKYLKCLAVHLCTVPVTQVVMVLAGVAVTAYCLSVRGLSWPESLALGTAVAAAIQLLPISPGSITRGVFVLYLMVRERDVRNYYIAAPISFLHVIGYLAFPLQMVTQNPALARFLAGRWTKNIVHLVPVFGEGGALLEHGVFDLFFNAPLSLSRSVRRGPWKWAAGAVLTAILVAAAAVAVYLRAVGAS